MHCNLSFLHSCCPCERLCERAALASASAEKCLRVSTVRILQRDLRTNCAAKLERRFPEHTEPETRATGYIGSNIVTCCVRRNCSLVQSELANGPTAKNSDSNIWFRSKEIFVVAIDYVLCGQDRVISFGSVQSTSTSTMVEGKTTTLCIVARRG